MTQVGIQSPVRTAAPTSIQPRVRRPFVWLDPQRIVHRLPASAERGLAYLQFFAEADVQVVVRSLVDLSVALQNPAQRPFVRSPGISVLNRRRRAALLWVNAVLDGDVSAETLRQLTHSWLPQLAGSGPDLRLAARRGRALVEYLRGTLTASVFDRDTDGHLLREASALHALECVLGAHLRAMQIVARV